MDKTLNKNTGDRGEQVAEKLLVGKGFVLLDKNWRCKLGELDLVMKDGNIIVFVEVKTKVGDRFGSPEEMVNARKLYRVKRIADWYLLAKGKPDARARIDVVAVVLDYGGEVVRTNHVENVGM